MVIPAVPVEGLPAVGTQADHPRRIDNVVIPIFDVQPHLRTAQSLAPAKFIGYWKVLRPRSKSASTFQIGVTVNGDRLHSPPRSCSVPRSPPRSIRSSFSHCGLPHNDHMTTDGVVTPTLSYPWTLVVGPASGNSTHHSPGGMLSTFLKPLPSSVPSRIWPFLKTRRYLALGTPLPLASFRLIST